MPSPQATKAALRRSLEPKVIPPAGLAELPFLGHTSFFDRGWRNPVVGDNYLRTEWEAYRSDPGCSSRLARVIQTNDGTFEVSCGEALARIAHPPSCF